MVFSFFLSYPNHCAPELERGQSCAECAACLSSSVEIDRTRMAFVYYPLIDLHGIYFGAPPVKMSTQNRASAAGGSKKFWGVLCDFYCFATGSRESELSSRAKKLPLPEPTKTFEESQLPMRTFEGKNRPFARTRP